MLRERAHDYTKKIVRSVLLRSGAWDWAALHAANTAMPDEVAEEPEQQQGDKPAADQEDWRADFEEALRELEKEEEEAAAQTAPTAPETSEATIAAEPAVEDTDDGAGRVLNQENVQAVFDELVRPALQADGGDITLVKVEDNNVYVELIGACSTCPSATVTMKMGIEQMLHDEFPELGELINVAGEPQPFF